MTPTPLLTVTLARGRRAWPGAALAIPGALPTARAPVLRGTGWRGRRSAAPVGGHKNTLLGFTRYPGTVFCTFSSSCLVLRCGKGEKHKGESVIAFRGGRQNSAERRLVAKLSREGKSVLFPAPSNFHFNWNFEASY